ncbi:hypothetical protein [Halocatena halophila]
MATNDVHEPVCARHRCSCGQLFDTADELKEHARTVHDAVV